MGRRWGTALRERLRGVRRDRFARGLFAIATLALVGRVLYVLVTLDDPLGEEGAFHRSLSLLVGNGEGFVQPIPDALTEARNPDASRPPLWTLVLALPVFFGVESQLVQQLLACLVGTGTVVVVGIAARQLAGRRAGLIAAGIAAVYPNVWLYERELQAETLVLLGTATLVALCYRFLTHPHRSTAAALGGVAGLLALTRADLVLAAPLVVAPLLMSMRWRSRKRRRRWALTAALAAAAVVAPWAIHNDGSFNEPVILSTGLGPAMVSGNCAPVLEGDLLGYRGPFCVAVVSAPGLDPVEQDHHLRRFAVETMDDDTPRLIGSVAAKLGRTFTLYRPTQQSHFDAERGTSIWVVRAGYAAWWALAVLAAGGVVVFRRRGITIVPLVGLFAVVVVSVGLTYGQTPARAPVEVGVVLLAAVAVDALTRRRDPAPHAPAVVVNGTVAGFDRTSPPRVHNAGDHAVAHDA